MNEFAMMLNDPEKQKLFALVFTHLLSFLIFWWILKKFAWRPMLKVLNDRRDKIQSEFNRIDELEKKFLTLQSEYQEKIKHVDESALIKYQEAISHGEKRAEKIISEASLEAKEILEKGRKQIKEELEMAQKNLQTEIYNLVFKLSSKFIEVNMNDDKQRDLIKRLVNEDLR